MRTLIVQIVPLLLAVSALLAAPCPVEAEGCPANPRNASLALWPGGTIPTGQTVIGTHPCGGVLTCKGGVPGNFASRQCHWDRAPAAHP